MIDFRTLGGMFRVMILLAVHSLLFAYSTHKWIATENWVYALVMLFVMTVFALIVVPVMIVGYQQIRLDVSRAQYEVEMLTPAVRLQIERNKGYAMAIDIVNSLDHLTSDQLAYLHELLTQSDTITITGDRVSWQVEGLSIPVWFAEEWYNELNLKEGLNLPAVRDWNDTPQHRDLKRTWVNAISSALVKQGVAVQSSGNLPARWITEDEQVQRSALKAIGLFMSIAINQISEGEHD